MSILKPFRSLNFNFLSNKDQIWNVLVALIVDNGLEIIKMGQFSGQGR